MGAQDVQKILEAAARKSPAEMLGLKPGDEKDQSAIETAYKSISEAIEPDLQGTGTPKEKTDAEDALKKLGDAKEFFLRQLAASATAGRAPTPDAEAGIKPTPSKSENSDAKADPLDQILNKATPGESKDKKKDKDPMLELVDEMQAMIADINKDVTDAFKRSFREAVAAFKENPSVKKFTNAVDKFADAVKEQAGQKMDALAQSDFVQKASSIMQKIKDLPGKFADAVGEKIKAGCAAALDKMTAGISAITPAVAAAQTQASTAEPVTRSPLATADDTSPSDPEVMEESDRYSLYEDAYYDDEEGVQMQGTNPALASDVDDGAPPALDPDDVDDEDQVAEDEAALAAVENAEIAALDKGPMAFDPSSLAEPPSMSAEKTDTLKSFMEAEITKIQTGGPSMDTSPLAESLVDDEEDIFNNGPAPAA